MSTGTCRWLFLLLFLITWTKHSNSKEIRVVCYYTNWSVYRPGTAKFSPQNINPYLCTHLIYAFGGFTKENTLKPFDKYQDIEKGGYAKFTGLKTYNKNLKTMLAIGGWNEGSSRFSPMVANPERRKELIKNAIKFLRQNHFDGLDLDWEYPSFRDGGKSRDRDNYAQLVQELREEFERESEKTGRPRLLLTMAVPAGIEYINKGYDVPKLTKYLDWMNILSYDYHSAFEPAVNHHAPLYPLEEPSEYNYDTELNIEYTIEHYLKKGADPNKLVLGIPTYGRSYTLFNPDANEIGAPADGPGDMGEATRENGYLAYYEICENIKSQDWEVVQPNEEAMGPYAFKDNQWVGYDDDGIARKKAAYVAKKNLGGIMFWSIDNDDFRGTCHGKPYPIIEAAKEALISAYGLTDENLVSPPAKPTKTKTRTRTQSSSKSSSSKIEENEKKVSSNSGSRRRNRVKSKSDSTSSSNRTKSRRKESRSTTEGPVYSSLELVTPSYTTPAPPPTPGMGGEFKCEDEGFYPHPKDCKKYFWCLSGPGELGIIAHQFTCPAGLYFNKAADSCDYTRNVLCNKKLSKGTTTTTTPATTSKTTATSTARVPPKITAATSRTTVFRTSTTTEAYEDEYEEYDDDEEEDSKNSEEDPRVIKELLDLIKKAGGIEELEKQLKLQEDGSISVSHSDATTPSSISKSLVERVLGKAAKKDARKTNSYSFLNRNSRGPQNDGLKTSEEKQKQDRGRPQYTTITRQRSQKSEDNESDEDEDDEEKTNRSPQRSSKKQPEYVNIRRGRTSTTTEEPDENSKTQINRNKILGEDEDSDDEIDEDEESNKKKGVSPQYVNIRRQRPATTEETSTSKYTVLRRGTTSEPEETDNSSSKKRGTTDVESSSTEKIDTKSKYKILRRGSTTEASTAESDSTSSSRRRGTTASSVQEETEKTKTRGSTTAGTEEKYKTLKRGSTTTSNSNTEETPSENSTLKSTRTSTTTQELDNTTVNSKSDSPITVEQILISSPDSLTLKTTASISTTNRPLDRSKIDSLLSSNGSGEGVYQTQTPQLLEPRPFSLSTSGPTSSLKPVTESSTRVTKVSDPNYKLRLRQKLPSTQTEVVSTTTLTTEKPTPFRTRAPSRYKQNTPSTLDHQTSRTTIKPSVRARKRFSTTTEQYSDSFEEYDVGRTFRPSEIADLSSLTAVDFTSLKEINRFNSPSRQRRPRPTFATSTTEQPEDSLKTGSRTLPLARKLLDGTTFGKSRRVFPNKDEQKVEDQINSSSDTTRRVRPFTRAPSNFTATTERTTKPTLRNRKVIRRLRPTVSSKLQAQNSSDNNPIVFKKLGRPSSTPATDTENLIENASSNSLYNRRFNRPSSTVAEEVNKLSSTTESLEKANKNNKKDEDEHNETSDDVSGEEGENIRLSESNIRENSNVNNQNVLNEDDGKKIRKKVLKRIRNKVDDDKATTEPSVIIRTRKIIRKLQPTDSSLLSITSTTESIEASTQNRKRKIIRRLRPATIPALSTAEPPTEKTLHIRGRPFLTHFSTEKTTVSEETEIPTEENKYTTSKYKTITRTTASLEADEEDEEHEREDSLKKTKPITFGRTSTKTIDEDTSSPRSIDRSKYSTLNRGTTSTTTNYGTDLEDVEDEYEKKEVGTQGRTKYRIYRPTIFHDDENDEDDEYEGEVADDEDKKEINEDALNIRNLRPTVEKEATTDNSELEVSNEKKDLDNDKDTEKIENVDLLTTEEPLTAESKDEKENDDEKEKDDKNDEEEQDITTTTTVRNYVNPILNRQKNRPAFVRPKLTTQNPLRSSTTSKLRYRAFSRSTTTRPSQLQTNLEEEKDEVDDTKTERKFLPKSYNRSKYVTTGRENRTSETPKDTSSEITDDTQKVNIETDDVSLNSTNTDAEIADTVEITTLEIDSSEKTFNNTNIDIDESGRNLTTQDISTTTSSYSINDTLNIFDDVTNETSIFTTDIKTVTPEITTITTIDLTTSKNIGIAEEASYNGTNSLNNITIDAAGELKTSSSTESETNETTLENNFDSTNNTTTDSLLDVSNSGESESNDTVISHNDLSTPADTTPETTPVYHPKSTLRSILSRPKYSVPKRLTSTESPSAATRATHKFNQRNQTTKPKLLTPNLRSTTPSSLPKNRFLYNRYSTTEKLRFATKDKNEEKDEYEDVPDDDEDLEDEPEEKVNTPQTSPRSYTSKTKARVSNKPEGYSFRKTTEAPKVSEDLGNIDTEAVRNRNKNLFSKKRKMNTPFVSQNPSSDEKPVTENTSQATLTTTPAISESVTKPTQEFETTEHLTTLHHVFAETELISGNKSATAETTTVPSTDNITKPTNAKLERLIEVNRIVEVHDKNNTVVHTDNKQVDKIGVINRVTVVKIVDGNPSPEENEIAEEKSESTTVSSKSVGVDDGFEIATVREIPNVDPRGGFSAESSPDRQNRKFEIYGESKIVDYSSKDSKSNQKGAEIIDGRSNINIITPRPYYSTEASTISLEALFQTDTPQKLNNINVNLLKTPNDDELLETGNSQYINVRVLGQGKQANDESQSVPIRVPKEEDYITMKAEVVEVTPKISKEFIKIVPIQVEMSRKLILNSDFDKKVENGVPKVNFQILKSANK